MTGEGRRESSLAELTLADEELRGADALLQAGCPRIALTRAYFAVFHGCRGSSIPPALNLGPMPASSICSTCTS